MSRTSAQRVAAEAAARARCGGEEAQRMEQVLGVIGAGPGSWRGVARFARFADFQRQVGELGQAQGWWGGHAVCHGLMNGLSRVVYAGITAPQDAAEVGEALAQLGRMGPLGGVVVPGDWGQAWALEVARRWAQARGQGGWEAHAKLWLDAPDDAGAGPQGVLSRARALASAGVGEAVGVVGPWVPTQSPGCWRQERLPGACVIAPLWLGVAPHLRGAHGLAGEQRLDPATEAAFEAAGAGWLWAAGARQQVRLQTPRPRRVEVERGPVTLAERIEAALDEASQGALTQGLAQGPRLWKQIERRAYNAMMGFAQAGEVVAFDLRCDAETNDGSAQPVVAVQYKTPQRVQRVVVRVGAR